MRIINLAAIGLITIAWVVRFYYFGKREKIVEEQVTVGTTTSTMLVKTEVRDGFWLVIYTLFVLPFMIFVFVCQELQISSERLAWVKLSFYFLDYHIGKALYLLLCASLILQHSDVLQWLVAVACFIIVGVNFVHPCLIGLDPINGEGAMILSIQQDRGVLKDLQKAEAEDAKKRIVK